MAEEKKKQPIDLAKICSKLWKNRKLYFIICPIVLVVTYLITLMVPRYYECKMELAPESTGASASSSSLSSLASSFGLGSLAKMAGNNDAISPELYPDLLKSPDFLVTLFTIHVETKDGSVKTNYYDYLVNHNAAAVWDKYIFGPIHEMMDPTPLSKYQGDKPVKVHTLDKKQQDILMSIASNIKCTIDKKTDAINITVQDNDPNVCATIGDSVLERMQAFIIDYRTKKARNDYAYYKKLRDKALAEYEQARRRYAGISDADMDAILESVKSNVEDKENDMQLKYNTYQTLAAQAQLAQGKIQENTPAFTVIQSATIPQKPKGPKRSLYSLGMMILSFIVVTVRVLNKKDDVKE